MKKIPKSINLLGRKWKIKTVNKGGAEFATGNAEITIGTKYPSRIPENLVHELLEIILAERMHRYCKGYGQTNESYLFSFNHAEFESICLDLAGALHQVKGCM